MSENSITMCPDGSYKLDRAHRMFPDPDGRKRRVDISIGSWEGICPGASHNTVRVTEQNNAVWSPEFDGWVQEYGDASLQGISMRATVMTEEQAAEVAKAYIRIAFGEDLPNHWISDDSGLVVPDEDGETP